MHLGYTSECCWRCLKWLIFLKNCPWKCLANWKGNNKVDLFGLVLSICEGTRCKCANYRVMDTQATYSINSCVGRCSRQAAWPAEASGRHTRGHHICLPTRIECLEHFTSGSSGHFPWVLTWTHQTSPHHIWMSWMSREEEQIFGMLPHNNHNTACRGTWHKLSGVVSSSIVRPASSNMLPAPPWPKPLALEMI